MTEQEEKLKKTLELAENNLYRAEWAALNHPSPQADNEFIQAKRAADAALRELQEFNMPLVKGGQGRTDSETIDIGLSLIVMIQAFIVGVLLFYVFKE